MNVAGIPTYLRSVLFYYFPTRDATPTVRISIF